MAPQESQSQLNEPSNDNNSSDHNSYHKTQINHTTSRRRRRSKFKIRMPNGIILLALLCCSSMFLDRFGEAAHRNTDANSRASRIKFKKHHLSPPPTPINYLQRPFAVGDELPPETLRPLLEAEKELPGGEEAKRAFNYFKDNEIDRAEASFVDELKPLKEKHKVPEQLPIVVSSSDNSYVSASPVIQTTTGNVLYPTHDEQEDEEPTLLPRIKMNLSEPAHFAAHYRIQPATIIKTRESIQSGATFLNYTIVTNRDACLVECWITESCDTAIYQESPVDFNNHLPYLSANLRHDHNTLASLQYVATTTSKNHHHVELHELARKFRETDGKGGVWLSETDDEYDDVEDMNEDFNNNDDDDEDDDDHEEGEEEDEEDENEEANEVDVDHHRRTNKPSSHKKQLNGFFICYLFECAKPEGFKCQFSAHNSYASAVKRRVSSKMSSTNELPSKEADIDLMQPLTTSTMMQDESEQLTDDESFQKKILQYKLASQTGDTNNDDRVIRGFLHKVTKPHYTKIVRSHMNGNEHHPLNGRWHDVASIRIGQEDLEEYPRGGFNSAIIAIMFGIGVTAMLIMVVGHKMKSIRHRLAYKSRRHSVVSGNDFLINTLPS